MREMLTIDFVDDPNPPRECTLVEVLESTLGDQDLEYFRTNLFRALNLLNQPVTASLPIEETNDLG